MYRYVGLWADPTYRYQNNNHANLLRGVVERIFLVNRVVDGETVMLPPPRPVREVYYSRMENVARQLRRHLPKSTPWTKEKFLASMTGRRKEVYAHAIESLRWLPVRLADSFMSTFVKAEKVSKLDPAPRVIQPRTPRYNVCVGLYIKPIEKLIYRALGLVWGGPTVMKGYNAEATGSHIRAMWQSFRRPVAVGVDATRFDQHVSRVALEWEHDVYLSCFNSRSDRNTLRRLLAWQLRNRGYGRTKDGGKVVYEVEGCRMSGDMNTGLGNCLLMSCMMKAWCDTKHIRARLANNGDDCVIILEQADLAGFLDGFDDWFLGMGFTMTVEEPVYTFEKIEFCQTHPVFDGSSWVMVRNPLKCITKDLTTVLPLSQGKLRYSYLTAVGECGLSLSGGIPLLQEFYAQLIRAGEGHHMGAAPQLESGFARLAAGMSRSYTEITPYARYSFWLAFGITPDYQVALETRLMSSTFNLADLRPWDNDLSRDYSQPPIVI